MEKKGWLTGKKVVGIVFILFLIDVSCFASWYIISNPPAEAIPEEAIRIGLAVDTTHYSGRHMLWGAQMAADEINQYGTGGPSEPGEGGGVLVGKERLPVVIVKEESQEMSPDVGTERTVAAVTKLITTYKVQVVIGGYATPMAALETCAKYKTIYICPSSSANSITEAVIANYEKYKYVFNTQENSTTLGMRMTNLYSWLRDTYNFTKVAIIAEEYVWCDAIIEYFKAHTPEGMEIVYEVRFPSTTTTFMPYLTKAKDADAQVIMTTIALDWAITFHKEWAAMQVGVTAGYAVPAERSTYWEETDGACKYHLEQIGGLPASNMTEKSFHFYHSFEEMFDEYPMYCAEQAYSAVYAYCQAAERAETTESDAVVSELEKTDMLTPYSRLRFTKSHSPCAGGEYDPCIVSQWLGPEYRPCVYCEVEKFLTDEPVAYAELTLPPWMQP